MVLADNVRLLPEQIGAFAVTVGANGIAITLGDIVPAGPTQPFTVAVTE